MSANTQSSTLAPNTIPIHQHLSLASPPTRPSATTLPPPQMATIEQRMKAAIEAWLSIAPSESRPSIRTHAKEYDVDRTTFSRRITGGSTRVGSHEHMQRLTQVQEEWLVNKIKEMDERGYPASNARVREMAKDICVANGDDAPLGRKWLEHFKQRNPDVRGALTRGVKAARFKRIRPV